ncbi:TrmH family RNA methyltransferase [Parachlamydia sp. AcF125]|uniref:TrmH family RNA methyltransferase n=1 Tax=Parachlamydia sp. AcF125 TaxID=2795736 RepID=UPI001BCA3200|nr:TrmH family RNA methyltransferase [Parachlamydia sp. AcF125]MBS4167968.1 putative TrmH family tRNA/rRNA methyltransferase [Parachlamydia sp. AcF125]
MFDFTKRKFLGLPIERQHKKCAELIRFLYAQKVEKEEREKLLETYQTLLSWMKMDLMALGNFKSLADQFHFHLKKAKMSLKEWNLLPQISTQDREKGWEEPGLIAIYLDNIRSAFNVGSIIRTVEAFSLGSVYFSKDTPFIEHAQVQKASMGTFEWVTCFKDVSLPDLPKPLIALETSPDALSLYDFVFPEIFSLILGNEEYGCSESTLKEADFLLQIPLTGRKNSINVANAFAIAAGEICRQKRVRESYDQV